MALQGCGDGAPSALLLQDGGIEKTHLIYIGVRVSHDDRAAAELLDTRRGVARTRVHTPKLPLQDDNPHFLI